MWLFLMNLWKKEVFLGNEVWQLVMLLVTVFFSLVVGQAGKFVIGLFVRKKTREEDKWLVVLFKSLERAILLLCFTFGLWVGIAYLTLTPSIRSVTDTILRVLTTVAIGFLFYCLIDILDHAITAWIEKRGGGIDRMIVPMISKSVRITLVALIIIQVLDVISDKPITSILAGLGVGGLAVALAGQETLKNVFGSIVLVADKPFDIGDRIKVESFDGPVESVGFRSTKIRTLDGTLVTIPNAEMANCKIENISKRTYVRHDVNIGVVYGTSPEKMKQAVSIVKDILSSRGNVYHPNYPPRVYFDKYNDYSLNIRVIYWYKTNDYWKYLEFAEGVNFEILKKFNENGIQFAFPTQTIYLENNSGD